MNTVPTFAVAGDPNVGKSTVIATLAEEDAIEISNRAGTTKVATRYAARVDGTPILEFIDLPGFENTQQLKEWFEEHRNAPGNLGAAFVAEFAEDRRYTAECEILRSIDGAAVIFVVDATRGVQPRDRDQAEILRLCTDKRMAVINTRSDREAGPENAHLLQEWKDLLSKHFTYQCFDPHRANFHDRIELLESISHVMPGWREPMKDAIQRFKDDWHERRIPLLASDLCQLLEDVINIRTREPLSRGQSHAERLAKENAEKKVRELEKKFRKKVCRVFQHKRADWDMPAHDVLGDDLFSEQVWKLFGLTRWQLVWSAAAIGAVIGAGVDLMVGGLSFFTGTALGAFIGAAGGFLAANKAMDLNVATNHVEAKVSPKSNLVWILIDRGLLFIQAAAAWAHGRRETKRVIEDGKIGITSQWNDADRKAVIQWIGALSSGNFGGNKTQEFEQRVRTLFRRDVEKLTSSTAR